MGAELDRARRAQAKLVALVGEHPDVNGIGIGRDGAAAVILRVNLRQGTGREALPEAVDGVPVHARVVGQVRAQEP